MTIGPKTSASLPWPRPVRKNSVRRRAEPRHACGCVGSCYRQSARSATMGSTRRARGGSHTAFRAAKVSANAGCERGDHDAEASEQTLLDGGNGRIITAGTQFARGKLILTQSDHRIHSRRATGGDIAGQQRDPTEEQDCRGERDGILRADAEQQRLDEPHTYEGGCRP